MDLVTTKLSYSRNDVIKAGYSTMYNEVIHAVN